MNVSPLGTPVLFGPKVYPHLLFLPGYPPLCHAFIFINLQIPSPACPPAQPFIFIYLQIPFPANPLDSHPYKTPGCHPTRPFPSRGSVSRLSVVAVANLMLSAACGLFVLSLRSFPHLFALFSILSGLFCQNTGGWGATSLLGHPLPPTSYPLYTQRLRSQAHN